MKLKIEVEIDEYGRRENSEVLAEILDSIRKSMITVESLGARCALDVGSIIVYVNDTNVGVVEIER